MAMVREIKLGVEGGETTGWSLEMAERPQWLSNEEFGSWGACRYRKAPSRKTNLAAGAAI